MKKAMIEVQFNWIFILIVGVIILMFFVSLTYWYKGNKDKELAGDVMSKIQAIMTGAGVNPRTATEIEIPRIELRFTCDTDCNNYGCPSNFQFEDTGIPKSTEMDILFTQNIIKSEFIHAWTQEWNMPYKVANFLYFSSPSVRYYLVYDTAYAGSEELAKDVERKLKENKFLIPKLLTGSQVGTVEYNNEYLLRFIIFYEPTGVVPVSDSVQDSKNWDVLYVSGDENSGVVKYSTRAGNNMAPDPNKVYEYMGMPSLLGAIYSEDFGFYKCNMKKAYLKLRTVNEIYKLKSQDLYNHYAGDNLCEFYYDIELINQFDQIETASADLDNVQIAQLSQAISRIDEINVQARLKSCTRIY